MRKKKSAAGIFFSMFLRAVVVILAIVIVALGVAIVRQVIKSGDNKNTENPSVDESILAGEDDDHLLTADGTETDTTSGDDSAATTELSTNRKIEVLNGTTTSGLAGHWRDTLKNNGYTNVDAHNYYMHLETTKIVAVSDGVGQDLLQYFPGAEYEVGTLTSNDTDAPLDGVEIFIIIGESDDVLSGQ